jgi:hypothetical protein
MARPINPETGGSFVAIDEDVAAILRTLAATEKRTIRAVAMTAIRKYAALQSAQ